MSDESEPSQNAYQPLEEVVDQETPEGRQPDPSPETSHTNAAAPKPLRWWPAAFLLVTMIGLRLITNAFDSPSIGVMMLSFMGPIAVGALLLLWWLFASRASLREKLMGFFGFLLLVAMGSSVTHVSLHGMGWIILTIPSAIIAFGLALVATAKLPNVRVPTALTGTLVVLALWTLVKNEGFTGRFEPEFLWRWEPSAEDKFMASLESRQRAETTPDESGVDFSEPADPEWPSFRGLDRNAVVTDVSIDENWSTREPKELWRIKVGPAWSSFSVAGDRVYTQEQREELEAVICLDAENGNLIWEVTYPSRFWEAIGGAGPRGTPTLSKDGVFTLGADGILLRIEASTGEIVWQRDLKVDAERSPPEWGFAASPLVTDELVVVHAGGESELGILAYDVQTGEPVWTAPSGDHSYSSVQTATIDGVDGLLMVTNDGIQFISANDGSIIWDHEYPAEGYRVVQPLVMGNSILVGSSVGAGTRKITVARQDDDSWDIQVDWTEDSMKPDYNDFVVHEGHIYGFDSGIFACVDVTNGERRWKRGRYGNGQVLLLAESGQLLISSEKGDVVLVRASPERLDERAKFSALEGKTWNHPVLIRNRLFIRNSAEAACFELPVLAEPTTATTQDENEGS